MTGDIDQEEIDGERRFRRGAFVLLFVALAAIGFFIWRIT